MKEKREVVKEFLNQFEECLENVKESALEELDKSYDYLINNPKTSLEDFISYMEMEEELDNLFMLKKVKQYTEKYKEYNNIWKYFKDDVDMLYDAYELLMDEEDVPIQEFIEEFELEDVID